MWIWQHVKRTDDNKIMLNCVRKLMKNKNEKKRPKLKKARKLAYLVSIYSKDDHKNFGEYQHCDMIVFFGFLSIESKYLVLVNCHFSHLSLDGLTFDSLLRRQKSSYILY